MFVLPLVIVGACVISSAFSMESSQSTDSSLKILSGLKPQELNNEIKSGPKAIEIDEIIQNDVIIFAHSTRKYRYYYWLENANVTLLGTFNEGLRELQHRLGTLKENSRIIAIYETGSAQDRLWCLNRIIQDRKLVWLILQSVNSNIDFDNLETVEKGEELRVVVQPEKDARIEWKQVSGPKARIAHSRMFHTCFYPSVIGDYEFEAKVIVETPAEDGASHTEEFSSTRKFHIEQVSGTVSK